MVKFSDFPAGMWGMAFFRAVANAVLGQKVALMQEVDCMNRYPSDIDWDTASCNLYAEKCPKRRRAAKIEGKQIPLPPEDECEHWPTCEMAVLLRHVCEESKRVPVCLAVHQHVSEAVQSMLRDKDVSDYAQRVWTEVSRNADPLGTMLRVYKRDVLGA